ncbi:hypothetical protein Mgra_00001804 [Meloidogyne graminicola]|uniref:Uncharacterized protein n=1 Tax=Meloidogyne graminicola TaxID=189291 RepID=A0A8S9ZZI4_9BILA|nr:hypothetical protein Mgra_00001804 [Meloidogyne graminicola]
MLTNLNINIANNTPKSTPRNVAIVKQSQKSVQRIDFDDDNEENNVSMPNKKLEEDQKKLQNNKTKKENDKKQTKEMKKVLNPDPDMRFTYTGIKEPDLYEDTFIRMLEKKTFESLEDDWPRNLELNDNFNIFEQLDDEYNNDFVAPI